MAGLARQARQQVLDLAAHDTALGRNEATDRLIGAVAIALGSFPALHPDQLPDFPGPHRQVARAGLTWRKVRRYWFGAIRLDDEWVITTVVFDTADLPARLTPDTD